MSPYRPEARFGMGGVEQNEDWIIVLFRDGVSSDYRLTAFNAASAIAGVNANLATVSGTGSWGDAFPPITDMEFDPVNQFLILAYDSNGPGPGGSIETSILAPQ